MISVLLAVAGTVLLVAAAIRWLPADDDATAELEGGRP
jgi:hypothetical protein